MHVFSTAIVQSALNSVNNDNIYNNYYNYPVQHFLSHTTTPLLVHVLVVNSAMTINTIRTIAVTIVSTLFSCIPTSWSIPCIAMSLEHPTSNNRWNIDEKQHGLLVSLIDTLLHSSCMNLFVREYVCSRRNWYARAIRYIEYNT